MLTVEKISVFYDGLQALRSISLEVMKEEFVCILGPNGAGKSTLLQSIVGLLHPKEGEIYFEGAPIHGSQPHQIAAAGIALVPEEAWLFPQMSVHENLLMGAFPKAARKKASRRLELVFGLFPRLRERRDQLSETLSGGERQMLAVGRGLMADPRLILLDEPSLGLAPMVVRDILNTLGRINKEQKITVLLTEQNVFHALKLSQRGYLLENSRIGMEGRSDELLQNDHIRKNYLGL
jgi:branched-chain amino acid transport system ATP-binding protein